MQASITLSHQRAHAASPMDAGEHLQKSCRLAILCPPIRRSADSYSDPLKLGPTVFGVANWLRTSHPRVQAQPGSGSTS